MTIGGGAVSGFRGDAEAGEAGEDCVPIVDWAAALGGGVSFVDA